MDGYGTIYIISALVGVLAVICFFALVFYVEDIKKFLYNQNGYKVNIQKAEEELFIGNKEKAIEYCLRAKYHAKTDLRRIVVEKLLSKINADK